MNDIVVRVENLSKLYRLGQIVGYQTLRESLTNAMSAPFRRLRSISHEPPATSEQPSYIWALKDVSFEVKRGEALAIIGSNGSGKSTLLKILSRITAPTEGYAEIHGRVGSLLEVGTGFNPELTGKENIYLNGAILGMKRAEINRRFDEIVEFSGVEKFLDTPVKRYSSGMYVRLAFAVAAHLEPEILIVDEVLSVGDAAFQKKCLGKMGNVARGGRTVLFVSHNMMAVKTLCPRSILLNQGVIELEGNTPRVIQHYLGTNDAESSGISWSGEQRPGNRSFKVNSVTLKAPDGSAIKSIELSRGVFVEIDFEVIEDGCRAGFALALFDSEGNCIFTSQSNMERNYYGKPMQCGRYICTCRLPGDFFNSGTFRISVIGFGANWSDAFRIDNVLTFSAIDDGVLRGDYYQEYSGLVRPRLEWNTRSSDSTKTGD